MDIVKITHGPIAITSPNIYVGMMAAVISGGTFAVSNNNLGGNPNFNVWKTCSVIHYRSPGQFKQAAATEGNALAFR